MMAACPFAELVDLAWQQGLTEPDPRSDLDGSDVMRKLVILAREAELDLEPESVKVESLVPPELANLSLDAFLDQGQILSEQMAERLKQAQSEDKVLRYVARLEKDGSATVGIEALDKNHALANLLPCDNVFAIESKWYKDNPLVIRGPEPVERLPPEPYSLTSIYWPVYSKLSRSHWLRFYCAT